MMTLSFTWLKIQSLYPELYGHFFSLNTIEFSDVLIKISFSTDDTSSL